MMIINNSLLYEQESSGALIPIHKDIGPPGPRACGPSALGGIFMIGSPESPTKIGNVII